VCITKTTQHSYLKSAAEFDIYIILFALFCTLTGPEQLLVSILLNVHNTASVTDSVTTTAAANVRNLYHFKEKFPTSHKNI